MQPDVDVNNDHREPTLHENMAQWFGLPEPRERDYEQVFGWYHAADDTRYWVHNPRDGSFRVVTSDGQWMRPTLAGDWEEDDLEGIRQHMDSLQFLSRPPLPDDLAGKHQSDPFTYEGSLFAWFFVPELRRWELGVLERRWRTEAKTKTATSESEGAPMAREERREGVLTLATKAFDVGVQLFDRYCNAMLLLGAWDAPDPRDGFRLILGAASEASSRFSQPTDIVRLVSRATGCEEQVVQSALAYSEALRLADHDWFRGAESEIIMPGIGGAF